METKRARGKNFSECEKQIALYVIEKFRHVVECKETDGMSIKKKNAAWEQIAEEFNTLSMASPRDARQLKVFWWNLKRMAKKSVAAKNKKSYLDVSNDDVEAVMEMLKKRQAEDKRRISETWSRSHKPEIMEVETGVLATVKEEVYDDVTTVKEEICEEDNAYQTENSHVEVPEEIPLPSYVNLDAHRHLSPSPENPAPVNRNRTTGLPKKKGKAPRLSTLQLKRIFYLKKIKMVNMEINYKRRIYELELKIKEKELKK